VAKRFAAGPFPHEWFGRRSPRPSANGDGMGGAIVLPAAVRVAQYPVGFLKFEERAALQSGRVGMHFQRPAPKGGPDVIAACVRGDAENYIIIFRHGSFILAAFQGPGSWAG
jgi:hypothetical protein